MSDVRDDQTAAYLRRIDARLDRLDARIEAMAREQTARRPRRDNLDKLLGTVRTLLIVCVVLAVGSFVLRLAIASGAAGWIWLLLAHPPR